MQDLQEVTQEVHYENFRAERLANGAVAPKKTKWVLVLAQGDLFTTCLILSPYIIHKLLLFILCLIPGSTWSSWLNRLTSVLKCNITSILHQITVGTCLWYLDSNDVLKCEEKYCRNHCTLSQRF